MKVCKIIKKSQEEFEEEAEEEPFGTAVVGERNERRRNHVQDSRKKKNASVPDCWMLLRTRPRTLAEEEEVAHRRRGIIM